MKLFIASTIFVSLAAGLYGQAKGGAAAPPMTLSIPGFPDGGQIPVKFSQAAPGVAVGEGTSPAISWANAPAGTQSFVINMHDMDLARNKTTDDQVHWVVWNIPGNSTGYAEGAPKGAQLPDGAYQISATGAMTESRISVTARTWLVSRGGVLALWRSDAQQRDLVALPP